MQPERDKNIEMGFQLAPMIDMTFLLLIFFMVTTKITSEQLKMEIKLPTASAAVTPEDISGREILNLDSEGQIFAGDKPVNIRELRAYLKRRLDANPPLRIYIRAAATTDSSVIKPVMKACAEAGAVDVIFGSYRQ